MTFFGHVLTILAIPNVDLSKHVLSITHFYSCFFLLFAKKIVFLKWLCGKYQALILLMKKLFHTIYNCFLNTKHIIKTFFQQINCQKGLSFRFITSIGLAEFHACYFSMKETFDECLFCFYYLFFTFSRFSSL